MLRRLSRGLLYAIALGLGVACDSAAQDPVAQPEIFRALNVGARTLYLQSDGWLELTLNGASFRYAGACEYCECETCPSCAICGRSLATVITIEPGGHVDYAWEGNGWLIVHNGCRADLDCERPEPIAAGDIAATVRYSDAFQVSDPSGPADQSIGPNIQSSTVAIHHPQSGIVQIDIQ